MPIPTEADEDWRYGRIDLLDLAEFDPVIDATDSAGHSIPLVAEIGDAAALIRTVNGVTTSCDVAAVRPEIRCLAGSQLDGAPDGYGSIVGSGEDAFTVLAEGFARDVVVIDIPRGVRVDHPVVIVHEVRATERRSAVFPRTFVALGEGAEATVVEYLVSDAGAPLVCPVSELKIDRGAHLAYFSVQELDRSAWQLGCVASLIERDGELRSFTAALGGDYARLSTRSRLEGENAASELLAAYFANGDQVQDMRTFQEHVAPRTRSNLIFKGAVDDIARSVYSGMIRIHKGARKSDAAQTNRNLVLSPGAHADSVPNLDIEENDVRCTHASAVGPVDREQLYYVESRGIPPEAAERVILLGFFDDLLMRAPEQGVARYLRGVIAERLAKSSVGESAGSSQ